MYNYKQQLQLYIQIENAHEQGWNLYPCGHYATETWGVKALATAVSAEFGVKWEFIPTGNPL